MAAIAVSSPNLARLRTDNQASKLGLAILHRAAIWSGTVATAPSSTDKVEQVVANETPTGGVLANYLLLVGTTVGGYEKGMVRIRKAPSTPTIDIGWTSEIDWEVGDKLTVVDEVPLFVRHIKVVGDIPYCDVDVAYSNQHAVTDPVPVITGPMALWLGPAGTASGLWDASQSWNVSGGSPTYSWAVTGGASITGPTSATPTITFPTAGVSYRISCAVTVAGKTTVAHRYCFVFSEAAMPIEQFTLEGVSGDYRSGGYGFKVTLFDSSADLSVVRNMAMVVLFSKDWYGEEEVSIGPISGMENVLTWGWIDGETIDWSPDLSTVSFSVKGPKDWLDKMTAFPIGLIDTASELADFAGGAPDSWLEFQGLTVNKFAWHLLHWRSTFTVACNLYPNTDTRLATVLESPGSSSLWAQLVNIATIRILAQPCCDRYGQLYIETEPNLTPESDRSSFVNVMALTTEDWAERMVIDRTIVSQAALVDASGVAWDGASEPLPFFSLANGHIFKHYGRVEPKDHLLATDQIQMNTLAGLIAGQINNEIPTLPVKLPANNRFFDIAPRQFFTLTVPATDNPRGYSFTTRKFWPRTLSYNYDAQNGFMVAEMTAEAETFAEIAVTGDAPQIAPTPDTSPAPDPIPTPANGSGGNMIGVARNASTDILIATADFLSGSPTWVDISGNLPGSTRYQVLRRDPFDNQNRAVMLADFYGVYFTNTLQDSPPNWRLSLSKAAMRTLVGNSSADFVAVAQMTIAAQGYVGTLALVHSASPGGSLLWYVYTNDYTHGIWYARPVTPMSSLTIADSSFITCYGIAVSQYDWRHVYVSIGGIRGGFTTGFQVRVHYTSDAGLSWSSADIESVGGFNHANGAALFLPYQGNGDDQILFVGTPGCAGSGEAGVWKSAAGIGGSFTLITPTGDFGRGPATPEAFDGGADSLYIPSVQGQGAGSVFLFYDGASVAQINSGAAGAFYGDGFGGWPYSSLQKQMHDGGLGIGKIARTVDGGVNWLDATGNLSSLLSSVEQVRYLVPSW